MRKNQGKTARLNKPGHADGLLLPKLNGGTRARPTDCFGDTASGLWRQLRSTGTAFAEQPGNGADITPRNTWGDVIRWAGRYSNGGNFAFLQRAQSGTI